MIGGFVRNSLSCSKAVSTSFDQEKRSEALRRLKNGSPFSPRRDIKRLRAAMQPVSFCMSFTDVGRFMLVMAKTLSGLGSMPQALTMYPRSIPDETLKMHFEGFSFHRYLFRLANVSSRSAMRLLAVLDLMTTSSM